MNAPTPRGRRQPICRQSFDARASRIAADFTAEEKELRGR